MKITQGEIENRQTVLRVELEDELVARARIGEGAFGEIYKGLFSGGGRCRCRPPASSPAAPPWWPGAPARGPAPIPPGGPAQAAAPSPPSSSHDQLHLQKNKKEALLSVLGVSAIPAIQNNQKADGRAHGAKP